VFDVDIQGMTLTVAHESGPYRHLRCRRPDTSLYHFDVVTWPGYLAISGDLNGGAYVFRAAADMLAFFAQGPGDNFGYWAEKLTGGRAQAQAFSPERFSAAVTAAYEEATDGGVSYPAIGLWSAIIRDVMPYRHDEHEAMRAVRDFRYIDPADPDGKRVVFTFDTTEMETFGWTHGYLWACYAIRWAAAQYRAHVRAATEARRDEEVA
jgi:hypothetical protein